MKRASAERITAIIPYFAYARQDKKQFFLREPITAKLVANLLTAAGVDRIVAVDLHSGQIQGFFDVPVDNLYALPLFVDFAKKKQLKNLVAVSPDAGATKKSERLATALNVPYAVLDKRRPEHNVASSTQVIGKVSGKTALILDDMIDTGGTICEAARVLSENGVKDIYVFATHPVLSGPALQRIQDSKITEAVFTNSIPVQGQPEKIKIISIAPVLAEAIKSVHKNDSVSKLFEKFFKGGK